MFIRDKFGHPLNVEQFISFYVDTNPDEGGYEVKANNEANNLSGQFVVDPPMSEPDAQALLERIATLVGTIDLND